MQEFMQAIEPIRKIGEKTGGAPVDPPDPPEDSAVKALLHFSADPVGSMAGALVDETGRAWEVLQGIFSTIDALNMTPPTSLWLQAGQYAAIGTSALSLDLRRWGAWTIELFVFNNGNPGRLIQWTYEGNTIGDVLDVAGGPYQMRIVSTLAGATAIEGEENSFKTSEWCHVEVSADGEGTSRVFVNGVLVAQGAYTADPADEARPRRLQIGGTTPDGIGIMGGFVDEFRFTQGVCRHVEDFTPPTVPLLVVS